MKLAQAYAAMWRTKTSSGDRKSQPRGNKPEGDGKGTKISAGFLRGKSEHCECFLNVHQRALRPSPFSIIRQPIHRQKIRRYKFTANFTRDKFVDAHFVLCKH